MPAASWATRRIGNTLSDDEGQAASDFSTTLLAMAGHDLRQPLQLITSAQMCWREHIAQGFDFDERLGRDAARRHVVLVHKDDGPRAVEEQDAPQLP
jgi:hypothetical protein